MLREVREVVAKLTRASSEHWWKVRVDLPIPRQPKSSLAVTGHMSKI